MTITNNDIGRIESATVYDHTGDKVGKVGQVYLDDTTGEPSWATVSTGFFGTAETFVPLQDARFDGDALHLTHDKDKIKDAPRVEVDQHLSETEEAELYRYYGLEMGGGNTGTAQPTTTTDDAAVTLSEERAVVDKETQESRRARLRKYTTTEHEQVSAAVRKEHVEIDGDVETR